MRSPFVEGAEVISDSYIHNEFNYEEDFVLEEENENDAEYSFESDLGLYEVGAVYPSRQGVSPFALQAKKQWSYANDLRPEGWRGAVYGLVVHTTGGSLPGKAVSKNVYPTLYAMNYYHGSFGCHYVNGWQGVQNGDLIQLTNEDKQAHGVGMSKQLESNFDRTSPEVLKTLWRKKWGVNKSPQDLLPGTKTANSCYVHVECIPVVYYINDKTVTDSRYTPMKPGLRFTKEQHDSIAILAFDIANRNNWPVDQKWWRTARLLGHEDLTPISRQDSKGGWDPGGLRNNPYFDWEYVFTQIENIYKYGIDSILKTPTPIVPELKDYVAPNSMSDPTLSIIAPMVVDSPTRASGISFSSSGLDTEKAIRLNNFYKTNLGWDQYQYQINDFLLPYSGQLNVSLDESSFAYAVSKWQQSIGFTGKNVDGVIGPDTWKIIGPLVSNNASDSQKIVNKLSLNVDSKTVAKINNFDNIISEISKNYNITASIIKGIIAAESGGNYLSGQNTSGYKGLMQAEQTNDQLTPSISIDTGTRKFIQFRDKSLIPWLQKLDVPILVNDDEYLKICLSCYNAGPVTAMKAVQYAHAAGNWRNWLQPDFYKRALVFSGGYAFYSNCKAGHSQGEYEKAKESRLKFKLKTSGWRTESDPPIWSTVKNLLHPITSCSIETKFNNTPGYLNKFISYKNYFDNNIGLNEINFEGLYGNFEDKHEAIDGEYKFNLNLDNYFSEEENYESYEHHDFILDKYNSENFSTNTDNEENFSEESFTNLYQEQFDWENETLPYIESQITDIDRAVALNQRYAQSIGWDQYIYQINDFLLPYSGQSNVSLSPQDFAQALSSWQASAGLSSDGILGPNTWRVLSPLVSAYNSSTSNPINPSSAPTNTNAQQEWSQFQAIRSRYPSWQLYEKVRNQVVSWGITNPGQYINDALMEWIANPNIHHHFGGFDNDPHKSYLNLKRLYTAKGIQNPAAYFSSNITSVIFFGKKTPCHIALKPVLLTAEQNLKARGQNFIFRNAWSFVPRTFNSKINKLSNHALGKAIDIDYQHNPHITDNRDILIIERVCGNLLPNGFLRESNPDTFRIASDHFKRSFNQQWISQQNDPKILEALRKRKISLAKYAQNGFFNLPSELVRELKRVGLTWGGQWNTAKDFMHFELT